MAGVVRADQPVDELTAYEWATEANFAGSVQVDAESVSLSLDDAGGFWERTVRRTWDLDADLTRCLRELEQLRALPPVAADTVEPVESESPAATAFDPPDAASA